jgi:hypothetical protein
LAKQSGLGDNFYVGGYDLSGDTAALDEIGGGPAVIDVTGINKSAYERIGGLRDGRIEWTSHFNPETAADDPGITADHQHVALSSLPMTDRQLMYFRGTTLGNPAAAMVGKQLNYDWTRGDDGKLTMKIRAESNGYGIEWGRSLTAGIRTDTAATNGTGIDTTASADFGAQAYLQVFDFSGTDVTVKIQDSADNATYADVAGFSFTQVTAGPTVERIATSNTATIRRYVRAVTVTTGGVTSVRFAVVVVKNEIAGQVF